MSILNLTTQLQALRNMFTSDSGGNGGGSSEGGNSDNGLPHNDDPFHRTINRISRLPRLILLLCIIGLFIWPVFDVVGFVAWATALSYVPESMWVVIMLIVGSWATTKVIRDFRSRSSTTFFHHEQETYGPVTPTPPLIENSPEQEGEYMESLNDPSTETNSAIEAWRNASQRN